MLANHIGFDYLQIFTAIISVLNPVGTVPLFLGLISARSSSERQSINYSSHRCQAGNDRDKHSHQNSGSSAGGNSCRIHGCGRERAFPVSCLKDI